MATKEKSDKKLSIRAGDTVSVNTKTAVGHKGIITKVNKNGNVLVVVLTHAPYTKGRKNWKLEENPQPKDERQSYAVKKAEKTTAQKLGKKHPDTKIKNPIDKSKVRNITNRAKKKKR